LKALYYEVNKTKRDSRILRFLGFKTTGGQDQYPNPMFSVTHLFEPSNATYSSDSLEKPAIAQGVLLQT